MRLRISYCGLAALCIYAQAVADRRSFDVASIKKADPRCVDGGAGFPMQLSPGRIVLQCLQVRLMIRMAYDDVTVRNLHPRPPDVIGGPSWIDSVRYVIEAKAAGATGIEMMGVLMQGLLKERFNLQIHKEPRQTPVYILAVGGRKPKLKPADKNACVVQDLSSFPPPFGVTLPSYCGMPRLNMTNGTSHVDSDSETMASFATILSGIVNRPVIDRTGIAGRYDIHLEFVREEFSSGVAMLNGVPSSAAVSPDVPAGPSVFTALQEQTGLKLTAGTAPVDVIVVDHVEQPTEN